MLEDERQNILDTIEKKRAGIEKDRKQIVGLTEKARSETNSLKKWMYEMRIQHEQSTLQTKQDDLKDLALNLEITDEAIESQRRDTMLIEANDHLPFPGELSSKMAESSVPAMPSENERLSGIVTYIEPLLNLGVSLFHTARKNQDAQDQQDQQDEENARAQAASVSSRKSKKHA